ncbi:MAG: hypothetical protein AAF892_18010 [Cyanobacteria bacterium P01_D01_bin.71]
MNDKGDLTGDKVDGKFGKNFILGGGKHRRPKYFPRAPGLLPTYEVERKDAWDF